MNKYKGTWSQKEWYQVTKNGKRLNPAKSQKIRNHSPDGFAWGYGGSGPAQLALALLLEECGVEKAKRYYMDFKWDVIAKFEREDGFELTSEQIMEWVEKWEGVQK